MRGSPRIPRHASSMQRRVVWRPSRPVSRLTSRRRRRSNRHAVRDVGLPYPNRAMRSLAAGMTAVDVSNYPDVHAYEDDTDALLWVLKVAADGGVAWSLSAAEASEVLVEVYRRDMTRQRATALFR